MAQRLSNRVLLVGWDAAEWSVIRPMLNDGQLPNVARLLDHGVMASLHPLRPRISPVLWASVATGKRPHKHGVLGWQNFSDNGRRVSRATSDIWIATPLWQMLSRSGLRTHCVNWYATSPAEPLNGICVGDTFFLPTAATADGQRRSCYPRDIFQTTAALRIDADAIDASHLQPFFPRGYTGVSPSRLRTCATILAESASIQAVALATLQNNPWDFAAVLFTGIERFSRAFMPFHPPRQDHVPAEEFDACREVIAAGYRFHDQMLGHLIDAAGDDVTVLLLSDHGYDTGTARAAISRAATVEDAATAHRPPGVFAMAGPAIREDETIEHASILDIAPTVLTLLGQRVGDDMDGHVLAHAFRSPVLPQRIKTCEIDRAAEPSHKQDEPDDNDPEIAYLLELGYTEPILPHERRRISQVRADTMLHRAYSLADAGQGAQAAALLERLLTTDPQQQQAMVALCETYLLLGKLAEARQLVEQQWDHGERGPLVRVALAVLDLHQRRPREALDHLTAAQQQADYVLPNLQLLVGRAYLRLQRWDLADTAFARELQLDDQNAAAWEGRAAAALGASQSQRAADYARQAVRINAELPLAHLRLGAALAQLNQPSQAVRALRRSVQLDPELLPAWRMLHRLYTDVLNQPEEAAEIRDQMDAAMLRRHLRRAIPPADAQWFDSQSARSADASTPSFAPAPS